MNMETGVLQLQRILSRAKRWSVIAEDVKMLPEPAEKVGKGVHGVSEANPVSNRRLARTSSGQKVVVEVGCGQFR